MKTYKILSIIFITIVTNIAFSNDHHEGEKSLMHGGILNEKFEKMSQFLNLDSTQEKTIKAIMSSSSKKMKESKDKLMINKEALRILNPNDMNFMKDLSLLSEEIGALTSEQSMLFGLSRERINNELNDDQRKLVKSFMGARSESHPKSRKSKFKKRIMSDKRDKRWNKKRRDKD